MNIRKIFIVEKEFQYSFIRKNLVLLLISFALIFATIKFWEKYKFDTGFLMQPPPNEQVEKWALEHHVEKNSVEFVSQFIVQARAYTLFDLVWKPLAAVMLLNALILIIANVYYSHKIAGPIYRLKRVLKQRIDGESIEPIHFRQNDPFHELADLINEILFKGQKK